MGLAEVGTGDNTQARIAQLKRRRAAADVVWMVGLLLAPGYLVFEFLGDTAFWLAGVCILLMVVGGVARSRQNKAIWALDPDNAPKPWKRTWLMDLDNEETRQDGSSS
jgi:hypothetical protein